MRRNSHRARRLAARLLIGTVMASAGATSAFAQTVLPAGTNAGIVGGSAVQFGTGPVISGATSNTAGADITNITMGAPRTILNWNSFNLNAGDTLNFITGSNSDIVLNRVIGGSGTQINGNINSAVGSTAGAVGGNVWFLDSAGIAVGGNALINVGGLLLGTLGVTDGDFFGDNAFHFSGTGGAITVSADAGATGQLAARGGAITLIAPKINFGGNADASGSIALIGARDAQIIFDGNLNAFIGVTINQGSDQANAIDVASSASFKAAGGRTLIIAAGSGGAALGSIVLGGISADRVEFVQGDVVLRVAGDVSSPTSLVTGGAVQSLAATGAGDLTIGAANVSLGTFDARAADDLTVGAITASFGDIYLNATDMLTGGGLPLVALNIYLSGGDFASGILGAATLQEANNLSITDTAGSLTISALTGVGAANNLTVTTTSGELRVGGISAGGAISLASATNLTLTDNINAGGNLVTLTASGPASIGAGTISQTGGIINAGTLTGSSVGTTDLMQDNQIGSLAAFSADYLRVKDTAGGLTVNGIITGTTGVGLVSNNGDLTISAPVTSASGHVSLSAFGSSADIRINAPISAVNGMAELLAIDPNGTISQSSAGKISASMLYGQSGGATTLDAATNEITTVNSFIAPTFAFLDAGGVTIDGQVGTGVSGGLVTIRTIGGPLILTRFATVAGGNVSLSTDGLFENQSGTDAVLAGTGGKWVIYASSPTGSSFGNLNSGNHAVWAGTYVTTPPSGITGNHYVFAYRPTVTFSPVTTSKVYGTDLTGSTGSLFTVSGLHAGVTGAFLADTPARAFSGSPLISSPGLAERASVAGGPYAISASTGTLSVLNGYQLVFGPSGSLTVTPKNIAGTVTATSKTYDGTTAATGSVSLAGVVGGDQVTASALLAFADKNAGSNKTVTISGGALAGTDAGNYTLSLPASTLASILQKALTGTVTATSKTYDGTTAATGSVSLAGVVGGDQVTASALLAFADKNAGSNKTVTISGGALAGTDAGNYTLSLPASTLASILQKALTGTVTATSKTYDGTTAATGSVSLSGLVGGDQVTASALLAFADKNAGSNKTVTISGGALAGTDAGNYTLSLPASTLASILQKALTGTVTATSKTYDGTTAATGSVSLAGVVGGDQVTASALLAFADKNAGSNKTVTISGGALAGTDAGNYTLSLPASTLASILQKALTGTVTATSKTYDGTTAATGSVSLAGVVGGDQVTASALLAFADKNAGSNKTVTISGGALAGTDAGNYTLSLPASTLASILQKALTGTVTATSKTYDGTTAATGSVSLAGVVGGDQVTASALLAFADKNAGSNKTVTISGGALAGTDAGNYTLSLPASTLASILQKALTGTVTATSKTYDGTTAATGSVSLSGLVGGDQVTASALLAFADKNAGSNKTVTISGGALAGTDAGNYTLSLPASTLASILQKALTGTVTATSKTYDGTTAATGSVSLAGVVGGDQVTASALLAFADKNAGSNKTVTISGGALAGTDAGNYTLSLPASTLASILQKALTGTVTATSKTYDGTTAATGSVSLAGVVGGDQVTASALLAFADKNAGSNKTVTISGGALAGTDAGNYTLSLPASTLASILQKALTGTVTATSKTYDGTTAATGSVSLSGLVGGDQVTASALLAFADKNAGSNKTVTISGGALAGTDAGNYTLSLPMAAFADILRRAITVTADAAVKNQSEADPAFTYGLTSGSLVGGDVLSGSLSRQAGEAPGAYDILQGSLAASANYDLSFIGNDLTIIGDAAIPEISLSDPFRSLMTYIATPTAQSADERLLVLDERCDNPHLQQPGQCTAN